MPTFPLDPNLPAPETETIRPVGGVSPTLRERIERGAAWLDSVKPDWRTWIDQDVLDLDAADYCILGQVFADEAAEADYDDGYNYVYGVHLQTYDSHWMANHGFDALGITRYADLETAWHRFLDGEW